jgi:hypothetical protein
MRLKSVLGCSILSAFVMTLAVGCDQGTEVKLADAPAVKPAETKPLPKDPKKGGGAASSGNLGRNPGADPLRPQ